MNIPELSMSLSQIDLSSKVGAAVLGKALDSAEANGDSLVKMMDNSMELSINPNIGGNFDMFV